MTSTGGHVAVDEIRDWLRNQFGTDAEFRTAPTPVTTGMDAEVWFIDVQGASLPPAWHAPLVLRVHRSADREATARREAAAQTWSIDHGYPAPEMLFVGGVAEGFTTPVQVMTRAPGQLLLTRITRQPWRAGHFLGTLARLHARLHRIDPSDWPEPEVTFARQRIDMVRAWTAELNDAALTQAFARVEPMVIALDAGPIAVCHGDFHPLNILVDGDRATVLDWTDAGKGDPVGDVARTALLLRVAGVATTSPMLRTALNAVAPTLSRTYMARYQRELPVDADRFRSWTTLHLLHAWAQVRALHQGLVGTDTERAQIPAGLSDWLSNRFVRSLAAR